MMALSLLKGPFVPQKSVLYSPQNVLPPTRFGVKSHPKTEEICAELEAYFLKHWPFENENAKAKFSRSQTNRWACLALPFVDDDRILDSVKVNTLLFLLNDE